MQKIIFGQVSTTFRYFVHVMKSSKFQKGLICLFFGRWRPITLEILVGGMQICIFRRALTVSTYIRLITTRLVNKSLFYSHDKQKTPQIPIKYQNFVTWPIYRQLNSRQATRVSCHVYNIRLILGPQQVYIVCFHDWTSGQTNIRMPTMVQS